MFGIAAVSTVLLFFLKTPVVQHPHQKNQETIVDVKKSHISNVPHAQEVTVMNGVSKLWNLCKDKRFLWIVP
jgi:hypothetical protein